MYVDINSVPEEYNASDALKALKQQQAMGILVSDPTKVINTISSDSSGNGLWNQLRNGGNPYPYPYEDPVATRMDEMQKQLDLVKIDLKLSRLKILALEGKFSEEEVTNIRKMILSEDEAARTLADAVIENA